MNRGDDYALAWDSRGVTCFLLLDDTGGFASLLPHPAPRSTFPTAKAALTALLHATDVTPVLFGDPDWTANVYATRVQWH